MDQKRMHKELYYLGIAEAASKRSTCINKQWGAVIVKDDEIISTGYNGSPRGQINCSDVGTCYRLEHNIPRGTCYETCFTGATKIRIPNGRSSSISVMNDKSATHTSRIYAYDSINDTINQVRAIAHASGYADELIRITVETGESFECTPNHLFMMDDYETFTSACELKQLDKLAGMMWKYNLDIPYREVVTKHSITVSNIQKIKISSTKPVPVYDLTVPEYENFAVQVGENVCVFAHNCRSVHAEANAIISAPRTSMLHATMYIYGHDCVANTPVNHPDSCTMCKRMIINSGINEVVFADIDGVRKMDHPTKLYGYRVVRVSDWINSPDFFESGY